MSYTGYQNADIMTTDWCSVNTIKAVRCDMDRCNRDFEAMASRKEHSKHFDCVWSQNSDNYNWKRWLKIQGTLAPVIQEEV